MSSVTITDPAGTSPANAYNNDKNLTEGVLLNVENSNLAQSKGLFKLNMFFYSLELDNLSVTQSGVAGNETQWQNLLRTQLPEACTLVHAGFAASKWTTLNGSNYWTVSVEKSTYTSSAVIPFNQWTSLGTMTIDATTDATELFKELTLNTDFSADHSFRFKLTKTGSPVAQLQFMATFKMEHI